MSSNNTTQTQKNIKNTQALQQTQMSEATIKTQYMCECGAVAKFFQLERGKHVCEQCTLNEIYAEESYQDVYGKVMLKMRNIMNLRTKQMLVKQQIAARD